MAVITYAQAAQLALRQEMLRDSRVWALGEDIGPEGGVAGQYLDLQREFGRQRIVDTPISESTIMGSAIGAAICGTRPVVELRYADFGLCAADEIVNQAAKARYMLGGQVRVPVVIRQPIGFREGMAAQHSQSTEAWWIHIPGLVVVAPATPADNHGLLKAAIRSDDPVVYMEHKELWTSAGEVDEGAAPAVLGKAAIRRAGNDLTLVTWSGQLGDCLLAAEAAQAAGLSIEVIDLRTLRPLDHETIVQSVQKTSRLVSAEEGWGPMGVGAEVVARVIEHAFDYLDAPPLRVHQEDVPLPYAANLEVLSLPGVDKVIKAVRAVMA